MNKSAASLLMLLALAGCDPEWDMGKQPKHEPHQESKFYADGLVNRPPVPGTVSREVKNIPGYPFAHSIPPFTASASEGQPNPLKIDRMTLDEGQLAYTINCSACHGRLGNGNGMIAQRGLVRPPSFHVDRLKAAPDSHFFNVISHGYGAMVSYDDKVAEMDRWKIAAYIRALQAAADAPNLPADVKAEFISAGDVSTQSSRETKPGQNVSQQGSGQ